MDIAVCDDNLSDREIIRQQLSIYFSDRFIEYNIDSYENGVNLIYSIEDGEYYDIIFLDMYMDKLNGIQVAEKLRNMNYKGKIIFLTVTSKYAVESYDVEASGYLVKPHDIDKISMVLDRVLSNYENVHTYQIKKRNSVIQVLYSEIEYIESSNSKCILHRRRMTRRDRAHDIRLHKDFRVRNRTIHVRLRRKVDDAVKVVFFKQRRHQFLVADIALHKDVALIPFHALQVLQIAGIRQLVQIDQENIVVLFEHVIYEVRSDKTRAAGDQIRFHLFSPIASMYFPSSTSFRYWPY